MNTEKKIIRFISAFLALVLCVETIFSPDLGFAFQGSSPAASAVRISDKIKLPEFARAEWTHAVPGSSSRGVIYLIQDAHTSLLAQQRIAQTLEHLRNQKALDAVLVEGASGQLTRERFAHIPDLRQVPELIEKLQRKGYLHGAAAFALLNPQVSASGIESPELYRSNFELFRAVMTSEKEVQRAVSAFQVEWQRWLKTITQKEDYDFFLSSASSHALSEDPGYFEQLIAMASRELGIQWQIRDQKEWPNLIRLQRMLEIQPKLNFKKAREEWLELKKLLPAFADSEGHMVDLRMNAEDAGNSVSEDAAELRDFAEKLVQELMRKRIPMMSRRAFFDWLAIAAFQAEIEPEGLIREIEKLEDQIWNKKFQSKEDRRAAKLGRMAVLFDQAGRLELSRGAVRRFETMVASDEFKFWISKLVPEKKKFILDFSAQLLQFYAVAERREAAFLEKLNRAVDTAAAVKSSLPYVAVVAGGYHKDGLLEPLKKKGFDVAVLTPKLDRIDHDIAYRDRMLEPAVETSTLSSVPAAVVLLDDLSQLVGKTVASSYEKDLKAELFEPSRSEARGEGHNSKDILEKGASQKVLNRRSFFWRMPGFILLGSSILPVINAAADDIDDLLKRAEKMKSSPPEAAEIELPTWQVEPLQMTTAEGMDGYLAGIKERVEQNLPGLISNWNSVLEQVERKRTTNLELRDITTNVLTLALRVIGGLLEEILVNPVLNNADVSAMRAGQYQRQWNMAKLSGEVARLLLSLKIAQAQAKVWETYIGNLKKIKAKAEALAKSNSVVDVQLVASVTSMLNEAQDHKDDLAIELMKAEVGLKMLLGDKFNFNSTQVPVPVQSWLEAKTKEDEASLVASAKSRAGNAFSVLAARANVLVHNTTAKAETRRNWFRISIPRGPVSTEDARRGFNVGGKKLSSSPAVAKQEVLSEIERLRAQQIKKELEGLSAVAGVQFFDAKRAHAERQRQVLENQEIWRTLGLGFSNLNLERLRSYEEFVYAQISVLGKRDVMGGASIALAAAGLLGKTAKSENYASLVLLSGFFPDGFTPKQPSAPRRSEIRATIKESYNNRGGFFQWAERHPQFMGWIQAILLGVMAFAAVGVGNAADGSGSLDLEDQPDSDADNVIASYSGMTNVSFASGDRPHLMLLTFPEIVAVNSEGEVNLSSEGLERYQILSEKFKSDFKNYIDSKENGAKVLDLLPRYKEILKQAIELDQFERLKAAFKTIRSKNFKVISPQAGQFGDGQSVMNFVSTQVVRVQLSVPFSQLMGAEVSAEINGEAATLLSPPAVLKIDSAGASGSVLIELTLKTSVPLDPADLDSQIDYKVNLKRGTSLGLVSSGAPAQLLIPDETGKLQLASVAIMERVWEPVSTPIFGVANLENDILPMGKVDAGQLMAKISFGRDGVFSFLTEEASRLATDAAKIFPVMDRMNVLAPDKVEALKRDQDLPQQVQAQLAELFDLKAPASGSLVASHELAAGFPQVADSAVAWIQTPRVLLKFIVPKDAAKRLSNAQDVTLNLPGGQQVKGRVQSTGSAQTVQDPKRTEIVVELKTPAKANELDFRPLMQESGFSAPFLFSLLAQAHQTTENASVLDSVGADATITEAARQTYRAPTLAQLISSSAEDEAHRDFKKNRDKIGSADYAPLLGSMHLSLANEAAMGAVREKGAWAEVLRVLQSAQNDSEVGRTRALYDALVRVLVSGDEKVDEDLKKLGNQARSDPALRQTANAFFAVLAAERGWGDPAVRRVLESQLWTLEELAELAFGLQASSDASVQKLAGGVKEWIWRSLADSQIAGIANSAFRQNVLNGKNPQEPLLSLSQEEFVKEMLYRQSLKDDRRLLMSGALTKGDLLPPAGAELIDPNTAESVVLPQVKAVPAIALIPGILGELPITLGEFDSITGFENQTNFLNAKAEAGDLEFLTSILNAKKSADLKTTAILSLQKTEQGRLAFARWFAWYAAADDDRDSVVLKASQALSIYGIDNLWGEILAEVKALQVSDAQSQEENEIFHPSLASKRQILIDSLLKLLGGHAKTLGKERVAAAEKLLWMLVIDPADLGSKARISVEAHKVADYASQGGKKAAEEELARRAILFAIQQFPELARKGRMLGENRLGLAANQIDALRELLQAGIFSSSNPFPQGSEPMSDRMIELIRVRITDENDAKALVQLAREYYEAGWTGDVKVPSNSITQGTSLFWTALKFVMNGLGIFFLVSLFRVFYQQARARTIKAAEMRKGNPVQFFETLAEWKKSWNYLVREKEIVAREEGKIKIWEKLSAWGDMLEAGDAARGYEDAVKNLAEELFKWDKFKLRVELMKGFRGDDRKRDKQAIFMLLALIRIHIDQLNRQPSLTPEQVSLFHYLKGHGERLALLSETLFHLKNLKDNQGYDAVLPNSQNKRIQRERLKTYRAQKRLWKLVRPMYLLDHVEDRIQSQLLETVSDYFRVSKDLGLLLISGEDQEGIRRYISEEHEPKEEVGQKVDNATIAIDRKLASRVLNLVGAIASVPGLLSQFYFVWTLGWAWSFMSAGAVLLLTNVILTFALFNYLSHLIANRSNLHDIQSEEFINFLSDAEQQIDRLPVVEAKGGAKPAKTAVPAGSPVIISEERVVEEGVVVEPLAKQKLRVAPAPAVTMPVFSRQWAEWKADPNIGAVVIFSESSTSDSVTKFIKSIGSPKKVYFDDQVQDLNNADELKKKMEEAGKELVSKNQISGKIVFVKADNTGQYLLLDENSENIMAGSKTLATKAESAAKPEKPTALEVTQPAFTVDDLLSELQAPNKNPGFDAVVIEVNAENANVLRPIIKKMIQEKYGYQVPVAVIGVDGVRSGNGMPAVRSFSDQERIEKELRKEPSFFEDVHDMKLLVLEAFGPDLDIASLTAGSVFLSPTGLKDRSGNAVTTGALALARAAISMRQFKKPVLIRLKTDTYNLNQPQVHPKGDITFAVTKLPAREVVGRFGVPIFSEKKPTKIKGFLEKADSFEKLQKLYFEKTGIKITPDAEIPVFTGDITLSFKKPERQERFQKSTSNLVSHFQSVLKENPTFRFDEVLDFWVPLIMTESEADDADVSKKDFLINYARYRAKVSFDGKRGDNLGNVKAEDDYKKLYLEILRQVEDSELKLSIRGVLGDGYFTDVRNVTDLANLNLNHNGEGHGTATPPRSSLESGLASVSQKKVVTFGLNGNRPNKDLEGLVMASVPLNSGKEAIVYGWGLSWGPDRLNGFGESHLGFNTDLFVDENRNPFLSALDFREMPLFPTGMSLPDETDRLVTAAQFLSEGKPVRVHGGLKGLADAGYVSLNQILANRVALGEDSPSLRYGVDAGTSPPRLSRSELRTLTQIVRTGVAAATLIVFYGILPMKALEAARALQRHQDSIGASLWRADRKALILIGTEMLEGIKVEEARPDQTLFVEGTLVEGQEILSRLRVLSASEFNTELLFTDKIKYNKAKDALLGQTELGNLKISFGANIREMVAQATTMKSSDDLDNKKNFAFLGKDEAMARSLRGTVANLMVLKQGDVIPASILLEALLSPAIFSLNFKPNKIWSIDLVLPMLLAARQIARSA